MDQFLKSTVDVLDLIGPEWRPFIVLLLMYVGWRVAKQRNWINGHAITLDEIEVVVAHQTEELRGRFEAVEMEVSNHIPTMIEDLKGTIEHDVVVTEKLSEYVRDQKESVNNAVKSMNIVLKKQDEDSRMLSAMDTKIQVLLSQGGS